MFTGLVEDIGRIVARVPRGPSARLTIATAMGPLALGESVCVSGVCLTVDHFGAGRFEADCSRETLARTTLGELSQGSRVHLERALQPESRLGGHFVSGHVDGKGTLTSRESVGDATKMGFRAPAELARYIAEKGSIAIEGVSLTVNGVSGAAFDVMIIPHTLSHTTLGALAVGDLVNLETDLLARYVARLLGFETEKTTDDTLLTKLRGSGYLG